MYMHTDTRTSKLKHTLTDAVYRCVHMQRHMHTHKHRNAHVQIQTYKAVHTHTHTDMCKHGTHIHVHSEHTHGFKSTHTHISTYTGAHTHIHRPTSTLIYTDVCTDVTDRYTHVHTLIQKYMERQAAGRYSTLTCVHTDTQTRKRQHTHKHGCVRISSDTHVSQTPGMPSGVV